MEGKKKKKKTLKRRGGGTPLKKKAKVLLKVTGELVRNGQLSNELLELDLRQHVQWEDEGGDESKKTKSRQNRAIFIVS